MAKTRSKTRSKTRKLNFTTRAIENLDAEEKNYNVFDEQTLGLGLAVYPSGKKRFFHLRFVQGWPQRVTLDAFPEMSVEAARGKAAELNGKLSKWKQNDYEGTNPVVRPKKISTLGEVLAHYCANHLKSEAKNPDSAIKNVKWQFDKYCAAFRNRPLGTISRESIRDLHEKIEADHGGVTANRTITFLRTLFNHALHPDIALWSGANPCAKPKKFLAEETSRDRKIEPSEKPVFFRELEKEKHADLRDVLILALATGARRGTILAMRWDQINWKRETWTIPKPKGRKKVAALTLPLTKMAVTVLRNRPRTSDEVNRPRTDDKRRRTSDEWVFAGRTGHVTTIEKPWRKFLERTKIADLRLFHDLRRTLATEEGETGASREAIQRTLGHAESSAATQIYDRSERRDEVRGAMDTAMRAMLKAGKTSARKLLTVKCVEAEA